MIETMSTHKKQIILRSVKGIGSIKGYKDSSLLFDYKPDGAYIETLAEADYVEYSELYILSDEIPQVGDLYYDPVVAILARRFTQNSEAFLDCMKIIATSDRTFEDLPKIPSSFIQLYIERYNRKDIIKEVLADPDIIINGAIKIELIKESWNREEVEEIVNKIFHEIHSGLDLVYGDQVIDFKISARQWVDKNL